MCSTREYSLRGIWKAEICVHNFDHQGALVTAPLQSIMSVLPHCNELAVLLFLVDLVLLFELDVEEWRGMVLSVLGSPPSYAAPTYTNAFDLYLCIWRLKPKCLDMDETLPKGRLWTDWKSSVWCREVVDNLETHHTLFTFNFFC